MSFGSKDGAWRVDAKQAAGVDTFGNEHVFNTTLDGTLEVAVIPSEAEDFGYVTGSLTSAGHVVGIGDCTGIRVKAVGVDSKFAISGGSPITLRSGDIFQIVPQGELVNPTIDWISGSIDVWMEVDGGALPGNPDLGLSLGIAHL